LYFYISIAVKRKKLTLYRRTYLTWKGFGQFNHHRDGKSIGFFHLSLVMPFLIDSMKLHKVDFDNTQEFVLLSDGKGVRIQSER
jgi:hypothetical protein